MGNSAKNRRSNPDDASAGPARSAGRAPAGRDRFTTADHEEVFEACPDPIVVFDGSGRVLKVNAALCRLIGCDKSDLLDARPADDSPAGTLHRRLGPHAASGRHRAAVMIRHRAGHPLFVEAISIPLRGDRSMAILRDHTTPASAQDGAEEFARDDVSGRRPVSLALVSVDRDGRITTWNHGATRMFGLSPDEAIGMDLLDILPLGRRDEHTRAFQRRLSEGPPADYLHVFTATAMRQDGTEFPVEITLTASQRHEGATIDGIIRDRSVERHLVDQLHDALQRLRFHIERMPLAYIVWDAEFKVVEWNPSAERVFGYAAAEAIGRTAAELIVPTDVSPHVDKVWRGLLKGDTSSHSINDNVTKDGSRITGEWFNTPLMDGTGAVYGVASMVVDLTDRRALEAQIRNAQKIESLGVLAGGVAHDFNSLLMVILGNTALLRGLKGMPKQAAEYLKLIDDSGFRAKDLISHLLTYARTGRHNPQRTDLNRVIEEAADLVRSSVGKGYLVELALADDLPAVFADRSQLERIVLNLCINAKQAMSNGGNITIRTNKTKLAGSMLARCAPNDAQPGIFAELSVTDTGCGLDAETASRIFDPFFTTKPAGRGLGLAAVLGILRQHNGAVLVQSKMDDGTTMRVFFPVADS